MKLLSTSILYLNQVKKESIMENRLRECPFCSAILSGGKMRHQSWCLLVWYTSWDAASKDVISAWNTRATDPLLEKMAEALEAADKFADGYHWAINRSLRNQIKQALQEYRERMKPAG